MSTRFVSRWAAVVVAVAVTCVSIKAEPPEPPEGALARVQGGGRAEVTSDGGFLLPGVVTEFSVNVWIDDPVLGDFGTFACFVQPGGGGFVADITGAEVLDNGCILLTGTSTCVFPGGGGVFFDEPVTIFVCGGGPGEGGFTVCFDNFVVDTPCDCDVEEVINGQIHVQIND